MIRYLSIFFVCMCLVVKANDQSPNYSESLGALRTFIEVFESIKNDYVEKIDDQTLIDFAIQGMVRNLDPHSSYLEPDDLSNLRDSTSGSFGGIGIEMNVVDGLIEVIAPIDESPAAMAGIQAKDIITHVDGESIEGTTLQKAVEKLRGPLGSIIELTIIRKENGIAKPIYVSLERAIIRVTSIGQHQLPHGIGYLRISQFQSRTGSDLIKAVGQLGAENELKGLILDLRNNPGGVLSAAIEVVDAFIEKGVIVSTKGRDEMLNQVYEATQDTVIDQQPIVILINGGSASGAEIVAGALQDHDRAVLIGSPTFGKGSVQTIMSLENRHALKLTTALYFTPNGRSIQATGIQPTIHVAGGEALIDSDRTTREVDLPSHLENADDSITMDTDTKERLEKDNQLLHAYNLLRGAQILAR